ncbi:MAG: D-glycero-alpha-D-manno-heptose-1,7-bisphosphate 7-phosphatase [Actinomycetota bacterium]
MRRRAVFVDKDGTLVPDLPYNIDPDRITLMDGAPEALYALQAAGFLVIVVSNQSGVARGLFTEADLQPVERRLRALLARHGVRLDDFVYCPHHPLGVVEGYALSCSCRKPQPGLIRRAGFRHGIDPARSWMIGDILDDVEAGARAGCRTVLVDAGNETEWRRAPLRTPEVVVADMRAAARAILASQPAGDHAQPEDART